MADIASSVNSTPKRKRSQLLESTSPELDTANFSFDLHAPPEDGSASPRSRVAHRFRGLAIESGGGVGASGARTSRSPEPRSAGDDPTDEARDGARKRVKFPDTDMTDVEGSEKPNTPPPPAPSPAATGASLIDQKAIAQAAPEVGATAMSVAFAPVPAAPTTSLRFVVAADTAASDYQTTQTSAAADIQGSQSEAEAEHNKSRNRKRAGTPPLMAKTNPAAADPDSEQPTITDPVRASLTWHEDEITVYDPEDSDDDGTGINGIGFKPTPAIAYARTVKRKQQLAEYRKREDREARARRSQRRRGSPATGLVELKEKVERRRVRFMESTAEVVGTV